MYNMYHVIYLWWSAEEELKSLTDHILPTIVVNSIYKGWTTTSLSSLLRQSVLLRMLCVCVLSVSPTASRSLLIPRRGFPSSSNAFRLGSRLRDAGRLTEINPIHMNIPKTQVMTVYY